MGRKLGVQNRKRKAEVISTPENVSFEKSTENMVDESSKNLPYKKQKEAADLNKSLDEMKQSTDDDGRSNDCVDGDSDYSRDSQLLLGMMPEELWFMVLEKIDNENDLENACNASGFFRQILLPHRINFLFSKVWSILNIKTNCKLKKKRSPFLSQRDALQLRLVSRKWCSSVDSCYENENDYEYKMKMDLDFGGARESQQKSYYSNYAKLVNKFQHDDLNMLPKFLKHFEISHCSDAVLRRSPFVNRKIIINWSHQETHQGSYRYFRTLKSLLLKFGMHVWHCEITAENEFPFRANYYSKLKELLQTMPNLKTLHVYCIRLISPPIGWNPSKKYVGPTPTLQQLVQLEKLISSHPMPKLEQLGFLKIRGVGVPASILNEFVRSNNHVAMLEIEQGIIYGEFNMNNVPNAASLKFSMYNI